MISELSFLIDLLMNHKLSRATKELIAERIKEVEANLNKPFTAKVTGSLPISNGGWGTQAPSTLANLEKMGGLPPIESEAPVEQIAQTPAAAQALQRRAEAMQGRGKELYKATPKPPPGMK